MDTTRMIGSVAGLGRMIIGGVLALLPRRVARAWTGAVAPSAESEMLLRALGARDAALGVATLAALDSHRETTAMLRLGFVADLTDAVTTFFTTPATDRLRRLLLPAVLAAMGAAGLVAVSVAERDDEPVINLTGEVRATMRDVPADVRTDRSHR